MTVSVRFGTPWPLRELSIDVVHEQLRSTIHEQSISPVDDTMAEDSIVSRRAQWSEQFSCRWMSDESYFLLFNATHATFEVYISDTEDKEDRDKNRNFENFAHKFKASPGHPIRQLHKDQLEEIRSYYWLSRAYKCSPGRGFRRLLLFVSVSC